MELFTLRVGCWRKAVNGILERRDTRRASGERRTRLIAWLHPLDVAKKRGGIKPGARHRRDGEGVGLKLHSAPLLHRGGRQQRVASKTIDENERDRSGVGFDRKRPARNRLCEHAGELGFAFRGKK